MLERNLHNYRIRTDMEAVIIRQPDLNNHVKHPCKTVLLVHNLL